MNQSSDYSAWTGSTVFSYGLRSVAIPTCRRLHRVSVNSVCGARGVGDRARSEAAVLMQRKRHQSKTSCAWLWEDRRWEDWFLSRRVRISGTKTDDRLPRSTGSVAAIAHGMSDNLIERAGWRGKWKSVVNLLLQGEKRHFRCCIWRTCILCKWASRLCLLSGFYHQPKPIDDLVDFMGRSYIGSFRYWANLCTALVWSA